MIKFLLVWNTVSFFLMGYDKKQSRNRGQRIPEKVLLGFSLLGGGIGAFLGSRVFHHKTKKTAFRIILPIGLIVSAVVFIYVLIQ